MAEGLGLAFCTYPLAKTYWKYLLRIFICLSTLVVDHVQLPRLPHGHCCPLMLSQTMEAPSCVDRYSSPFALEGKEQVLFTSMNSRNFRRKKRMVQGTCRR